MLLNQKKLDWNASPGLKAGRGLKQLHLRAHLRSPLASPGLKAGRGLKRIMKRLAGIVLPHRPASRPGAD